MSVKIDESGRRYVEVEVEVPGTPEEVWRAIATGPGVSAWFVPTTIEERVGGTIVASFGEGMDSTATVTAWEPPHRFAANSPEMAPYTPEMATEWTVEARSGGTCVVRVVHSLFGSTDEWDNQLESTESGWPTFFRILELYLEHFRGAHAASLSLMGPAQGSLPEAWDTIRATLGFGDLADGNRCATSGAGAPPLAGVVEPLSEDPNGRRVLIRTDAPAPGVAMVGAFGCGGVMAAVSLYVYGDDADEVLARVGPAWRAWLAEHFSASGAAGAS